MADAPKILGTDTLRQAYPKLNQAIDNANEALNKATVAETTSRSVQEQMDQLVIEGDSSIEAAQARVDSEGFAFATLKERLDTKETEFATQLAGKADQLELNSVNQKIGDIAGLTTEDKSNIVSAINELKNLSRFEWLGLLSLILKGSLYLKNDNNLFGYSNNGNPINLATIQQNDIMKYGDFAADIMWLVAKEYFSFRSKGNPTYQQLDDAGNPVGPGRTMYHQGNQAHHVILNTTSGTQTLTQNTRNYLTVLNSVVSHFPTGNLSGIDYTIPRTGVYAFNFVIRPTAVANQISILRLGFTKDRIGTPSHTDALDIILSSVYGTGFYNGTFFYHLAQGEVITPFANPLNENLTLQAGTKLYIYFLGDRPTI